MLPTLLKFLQFYTQAPTFPNQWSFISPNKMFNQHITITALAVPTGYHLQAGLFLHKFVKYHILQQYLSSSWDAGSWGFHLRHFYKHHAKPFV